MNRVDRHSMNIEINEGTDAKSKFKEVEAEVPEGVSIVPIGLEEGESETFIIFPDDSDTVKKLLDQSGVEYIEPSTEEGSSTLVLNSEEFLLPTLYFAYRFTKDNWGQVESALEKISEYYSRLYNQEVELNIEQEMADGSTTRFTYRGPPEQFDELAEEISTLVDDEVEVEDEQES